MDSNATTDGSAPPASAPNTFAYHCRMCRVRLFTSHEVVPHESNPNKGKAFKTGAKVGSAETSCTSAFLDPDQTPWVAEESRAHVAQLQSERKGTQNASVQAKEAEVGDLDTIYCFQCRAKLGGRSWTGAQCSCGAWITPAFRIALSRVDQFPLQE